MKYLRRLKGVLRRIRSMFSDLWSHPQIMRIMVRSAFLTNVYWFFNRSLIVDQRKILAGLMGYQNAELNRIGLPVYHLRRDTHRLEKGLSMRNRRGVFAEKYVGTVVDCLSKVLLHAKQSNSPYREHLLETSQWSIDVLTEYFRVVGHTPQIDEARRRFAALLTGYDLIAGTQYPVARGNEPPPVLYESLLNLALRRRSVRWFTQDTVERSKVDQAIEVARYSPSACNRQAYEFRVYDDVDLVRKACKLAPGATEMWANISCLVVVTGKYRAYFHERDQHAIFIDASLATMAFEFALETLGLASCTINWPSSPKLESDMGKVIGLAADERVIMLIAVGHPDPAGMVPFSQKVPLEAIRSYNRVSAD